MNKMILDHKNICTTQTTKEKDQTLDLISFFQAEKMNELVMHILLGLTPSKYVFSGIIENIWLFYILPNLFGGQKTILFADN